MFHVHEAAFLALRLESHSRLFLGHVLALLALQCIHLLLLLGFAVAVDWEEKRKRRRRRRSWMKENSENYAELSAQVMSAWSP